MQLTDYNLDTKDIAEKLGYHVQYVRFLCEQKKLPAVKRGREWRFNEAEVLAYLKKQTPSKGTKNAKSDSIGDMLR